MRRTLSFLRRARRAAICLPPQTTRKSALALSGAVAAAVALASVSALAVSGPKGLATTRSDLTPKDQRRVEAVTKPTTDFSKPEQFELMQGGAGTSKKRVNADAFSQSSANITFEEEGTFKLGNALFRKNWVSSPSSTQASDGLGPLFNARACQSCHLKDGRGHPPEASLDATSMFLRLAREASTAEEKAKVAGHQALNFPDSVYGTQLQDLAVPGISSEGRMHITYEEQKVTRSISGGGASVSPSRSCTPVGMARHAAWAGVQSPQ
jgi:CxxC motif-containing protein (DUF1111 family)